MSRRRKIHDHYEPRIHPLRESFDVLDWADAGSQIARFKVLADHVDIAGKCLLDVGCGLGDLWHYLNLRGIAVNYTGVDLLAKMIAEAQRRCPGARLVVGDVFKGEALAGETFDVVFCSGAFNLNLGNNKQFLRQAVRRLLELSHRTVAFNLLHQRARRLRSSKLYYYYDPRDVLRFVESLGCGARILDDYLPNDFTVVCEKTKEPGT